MKCKTCKICSSKKYGLGYCIKHYTRYKKYGNPEFVKYKLEYHGMTGTRIYRVYKAMVARCKNHKNYSKRGIQCLWETFEEFYKDMGTSYKQGLTIDRINNNGDYCKDNCRWATYKQQANNRRSNIVIDYKGKTQNLMEWCNELQLPYGTIIARITKYGYSAEKAFTTPIKTRTRN